MLGKLGANSDPVFLNALKVIAPSLKSVEDQTFEHLIEMLTSESDLLIRLSAIEAAGSLRLAKSQRRRIIETSVSLGPLEVQSLLRTLSPSLNDNEMITLLEQLAGSGNVAALGDELLHPLTKKRSHGVQQSVDMIRKRRLEIFANQLKYLNQIESELPAGDIRRGQKVFNGSKAACSTCHEIGYQGGQLGPDLTRIGRIRSRADLLESIVFPSLSFVRSYEPMTIVTIDGRQFSGLIKEETGERISIVEGPQRERTLLRSNIEEIHPATTSIMPGGLEKQLSRQELSDLLTFLENAR